MATRRLRSRAQINADSNSRVTSASSRPRRAAAAPTSATIERTSPEESRQSIHLTVKAAPSKLREATSGSSSSRRNAGVNSRDSFVGGEIVVGQRSSRAKKPIVEESSEEEMDEEDEVDDDEVEEDEEEDEDMAEDDDADADADEDVDMEDSLPAPPPPATKARGRQKPSINVTPAEVEVPSVEAKEMAMVDDQSEDEELSELDSADEQEEDEGDEDDAEGDDDDLDEDMDSDEDTPMSGSRSATPDLSKLTRRQRAALEETFEGELIALSNEAQKKKHLTAEEHAMRRAEMARRRKNLSEKRNEEEKMDTINRLLKKQAPKRRGKAQADADGEDGEPEERAPPLYVRYIQTVENSQIAVPDEWLASPLAEALTKSRPSTVKTPFAGRMVQEVA